jgi:serine phosphatase RsbU (regulator of sigma subunit)
MYIQNRFWVSYIFYFIFIFGSYTGYSQNSELEDQLWKEYNSTKKNQNSVLTLIKISEACYIRDRALSEKIAKKAFEEAKKTKNKKIIAKATLRLTNVYFENGKYEESYYLADNLLKLSEEINDDYFYAEASVIIGRRYHFRGEYPKALEYYLISLDHFEKGNYQREMSNVYNSIGGIYLNQVETKNAYTFYHKSQAIQYKLKDNNGIARGYLNISNIYVIDKNFKKAKVFLDSAYYYYDLIDSDIGKAYVYSNYSDIFLGKGQQDSALFCLLKGYAIIKKLNQLYTLSQVTMSIADLYFKKNDTKNSLIYVDEGIEIANKTKQSHNLVPLFLLKSQLLEKAGKTLEALDNYKLYKKYADTVLNASNIKKQTEDLLKYDYNKKEYLQEIEKQTQLVKQKERDAKQRVILNTTLIGIICLVAVLFLVIRSYRNNQKNSKIIAEQKNEVEKQHHLLQEKNNEVRDSILYAKRLQNAILPSNELIKKYLPESFVLYKPKDIVAGDFYWMEIIHPDKLSSTKGSQILIAAADCTGHGVPGSLVSVVCCNALNRSVFEFGLTDPGKILDKTRELVIATFEKSDEDVKDGMDISLCSIDPETNKLLWAGANNPIWIINSNDQFKEIKANKQPIGKHTAQVPFTTHEIQLTKGDRIYMFTDGYADQFGGEKGKKFKNKQFQNTLLTLMNLPIEQQRDLLERKFEDWKGDLEQIDDVCVIGIKI